MGTKRATLVRDLEARGLGFLANVILHQTRRPVAKLAGVVKLVQDGREVRLAQFSTSRILIDGRLFGMEVLESPDLVRTWRTVATTEAAYATELAQLSTMAEAR